MEKVGRNVVAWTFGTSKRTQNWRHTMNGEWLPSRREVTCMTVRVKGNP